MLWRIYRKSMRHSWPRIRLCSSRRQDQLQGHKLLRATNRTKWVTQLLSSRQVEGLGRSVRRCSWRSMTCLMRGRKGPTCRGNLDWARRRQCLRSTLRSICQNWAQSRRPSYKRRLRRLRCSRRRRFTWRSKAIVKWERSTRDSVRTWRCTGSMMSAWRHAQSSSSRCMRSSCSQISRISSRSTHTCLSSYARSTRQM